MGSIIDKPTCVNCNHSMERDHANVWCRRFPPQMFFVQVGKTSMLALPGGNQAAQIQGEWISTFPSMQKTAPGCGEWKPMQPIEADLTKLSPEQMKAIREEMAKPSKVETAHFPTLSEREIAELESDGWRKSRP